MSAKNIRSGGVFAVGWGATDFILTKVATTSGIFTDFPGFSAWLLERGGQALAAMSVDGVIVAIGVLMLAWSWWGDRIKVILGSKNGEPSEQPSAYQDITTASQPYLARLREIGDSLERREKANGAADRKIEELQRDSLILIDTALHVIASSAVRDLLDRAPPLSEFVDGSTPESGWLKNQTDIADGYLRLVREQLSNTYHWTEIQRDVTHAGEMAVHHLTSMPPVDRPQSVDPYLLQAYVAAKARCEQAVAYLKRAQAESERNRSGYLSHLQQQMRLKQPT